jgi:trimeric autotransporter adhesin
MQRSGLARAYDSGSGEYSAASLSMRVCSVPGHETRGLQKVIRQSTNLGGAHGSRSFVLAFLLVIPAWSQAQTTPQFTITTIAGALGEVGSYSGDGGAATNALLWGPSDLIFDSSGNLYVSDSINDLIRLINSSGTISTFAGSCPSTPCAGAFAGDGGAATKASLNTPAGMTFDSSANFYTADTRNFVIRKVAGGDISTVAGKNVGVPFAGDLGAATSAGITPTGVAVDPSLNIYIADSGNNVVRVVCQTQAPIACTNNAFVGGAVWAAGDINTFAGNNATGAGYVGDGGVATGALLNNPTAVLLDSSGNLYISDSGNSAIRKVAAATSIITTVAGDGTGIAGYSGDGGLATQAKLNNPKGIALDSSGNLYIADSDNCAIRMVNAATGIITTIAGIPPAVAGAVAMCGSSGDGGLATGAKLSFPSGVAVNGGKVYVADFGNNAIRLLTPAAEVPQIGAGGVVNDASYSAPVAPGSIAAVFGNFFLSVPSSDTDLPLVTTLQSLSFQFGSTAAPLYYVSGGQANVQVPWELAGQTTANLTATLNGASGAAQAVTVAPFAPAIFTLNSQGTGPGAILDSAYNLVGSSNPATAGATTILIYCTGLGAVGNQPATGSAAPGSPLAETTTAPTVTIGGVTANASFSGLAPGYVGLYQVNVLVPAGVAAGNAVPVAISIGGVTSNTATIVVQ